MTDREMLIVEAKNAPEIDVRNALAGFVTRRLQREEAAARAARHAEILPQCRAQLGLVTRMRDVEFPAAAERVAQSWLTLDHANKRLWAHQGNRPGADAYPGEDEIAAYDELTAVLEGEAAEARAEKLAAGAARDKLNADFLAACDLLARLQREESALRPKVEEPHRSGFSLGAVR